MHATRTCDQCGKPLPPEGRFCAHCGSFSGSSGTASSPGEAPRRGPWERILDKLKVVTASRYDVQRLLGWGGMAGVYLAEELRLKRRVAIKVISPGLLMDPSQIERFEQEARTTAQLNHPNIVTIYEVDEREDLHYFTMTYVPGRSLSQVMAEAATPLPLDVVQAWVRQVSGALSYAHQRGVVHRDIKPGNILLDEQGNALVGDFGIAKVAEEPGLTRTGMLVGTPAYMSPEQCTTGKVTGASDQYSLGAVAYQLIAGEPPFTGSTIQVIQAHVGETPRDVRELRPECPDGLAEVVMRMLAKDPGDRWPSLYDAVDAIGGRTLRHDDPVRAVLARLSSWTHGVVIEPPRALADDPGASKLLPGEAHRFRAVAVDHAGEPLPHRKVEWSARPSGVLEVGADGRVQAVTPGRATLVAASGRVRAEWAVKVSSSETTGPITPAPGFPAPGAEPVAVDSAPTPGPPPAPSSAPPDPPTPVPVADPTPVPAPAPDPGVQPPADEAPGEPAPGTLVMNLDADAAPEAPAPADPAGDALDDDDEAGSATRVVAGAAAAARTPPTPAPAPEPEPTPAASESAVPAPGDGAPAVLTRSRRRPEKAGSNRTPVAVGVGVVAVAAVAAVFALGGDDETPPGAPGSAEPPVATPADPGAAVPTDDAPTAETEAPGDEVVAASDDAPDDSQTDDPGPATPDPAPADPPATAPASTPASQAPPREASPAAPAPGTVRIVGQLPGDAQVRIRGQGVDRTTGDRTLRLAPGSYTLEITAEGYRPATAELTVRPGWTQDWGPDLERVPAPTDEAAPADPPPASAYTPEPEAPAADAAAVREARIVAAVQAFGTALQSRQPNQLRIAWPTISDAEARPWEQFMGSRDIQNLQVDVTVQSVPAGDGDTVEVPFLLRLRYQNPASPPPSDPIPYRAVVIRSGDAWFLDSVGPAGD